MGLFHFSVLEDPFFDYILLSFIWKGHTRDALLSRTIAGTLSNYLRNDTRYLHIGRWVNIHNVKQERSTENTINSDVSIISTCIECVNAAWQLTRLACSCNLHCNCVALD